MNQAIGHHHDFKSGHKEFVHISPFKETLRSIYSGSYVTNYALCAFQESPISYFFPYFMVQD